MNSHPGGTPAARDSSAPHLPVPRAMQPLEPIRPAPTPPPRTSAVFWPRLGSTHSASLRLPGTRGVPYPGSAHQSSRFGPVPPGPRAQPIKNHAVLRIPRSAHWEISLHIPLRSRPLCPGSTLPWLYLPSPAPDTERSARSVPGFACQDSEPRVPPRPRPPAPGSAARKLSGLPQAPPSLLEYWRQLVRTGGFVRRVLSLSPRHGLWRGTSPPPPSTSQPAPRGTPVSTAAATGEGVQALHPGSGRARRCGPLVPSRSFERAGP